MSELPAARIEVLAVGDELLLGATIDTNSSFVARELFALGLELGRVGVVGDAAEEIREALDAALGRARVLIVTGGLGPTVDDRTKEVVAEHFGDALELDEAVLADIRARFERRGRPMPAINVKQALLPRSARKIPNPVGSAPGVHWSRDGRDVFLLPGVPMEMQAMLREYVLPRLPGILRGGGAGVLPGGGLRYAAFRTCGLPESEIAERLQDAIAREGQVRWAFYPSWHGVDVKLRQAGGDEAAWRELCNEVRATLAHYIYTENADEPLEEVVRRLLTERGLRLAVAESCTGGMVAARITEVPGSSAYFEGGFVTYSNASKLAWLGVPEALLREHGAVSAPVAAAMARGARERARTHLGLGVTGVAGPTGGTPEKPVGLVFLALATADTCWTRRLQIGMRRDLNRAVSTQLTLDLVRRQVLGLPVGDPA